MKVKHFLKVNFCKTTRNSWRFTKVSPVEFSYLIPGQIMFDIKEREKWFTFYQDSTDFPIWNINANPTCTIWDFNVLTPNENPTFTKKFIAH